jgi:hypothetical protein
MINSTFVSAAIVKTNNHNEEYKKILDYLTQKRNSRNTRGGGVQTAREYEYAIRKLGGKGTFSTTKDENKAILDGFKLNEDGSISRVDGSSAFDGYDGHHINNVKDHPDLQSNPDNIEFVTEEEHLKRHGGDFRNKTEGNLENKDKLLKNANTNRVMKNEIGKIAMAAGIAAGVAFSISFAIHLYQNGISMETLKSGLINSTKRGIEVGALTGVSYAVSRFSAVTITKIAENAFTNIGIQLSKDALYAINMGVVGIITTSIMSVWQFIKLKKAGYSTRYAFKQVVINASISLALIGVMCITALYFGAKVAGIVGFVLGVVITTGSVAYTIIKVSEDKETLNSIQIFAINLNKPNYV